MSNTKLSQDQNAERKSMKREFFSLRGQLFCYEGFTVAIKPSFFGSTMAHVACSFASTAEIKMRRKVGEFYALDRMYNNEVMQAKLEFWQFEEFADNLANFFIGS